jgi:hypothetical protein
VKKNTEEERKKEREREKETDKRRKTDYPKRPTIFECRYRLPKNKRQSTQINSNQPQTNVWRKGTKAAAQTCTVLLL